LNAAVALEDTDTRDRQLLEWERAPRARLAHPREDHLVPLLAVVGAAGKDRGQVLFAENVMKIPMTSYAFGTLRNERAPHPDTTRSASAPTPA
jgi:aromatic ring-opening dioxygenase catalytic subunit (LigB family)